MPDTRFHYKPPTRIVTPSATPEDTQFDSSLRPRRRDDFTGQPKVILDLACGLNPLAAAWMPLAPGATYHAVDVYQDMVSSDYNTRLNGHR